MGRSVSQASFHCLFSENLPKMAKNMPTLDQVLDEDVKRHGDDYVHGGV
jgi:hypothetical protein